MLSLVFEELMAYGKEHFEREELIANAVGYPNTDHMHESHSKLTVELGKLKEEIGSTWTDVASSHFAALLRDWLIQHVIKEDLLMKPSLAKFAPTFNPNSSLAENVKTTQEDDALFEQMDTVNFEVDPNMQTTR